jgi:hypothetical protein
VGALAAEPPPVRGTEALGGQIVLAGHDLEGAIDHVASHVSSYLRRGIPARVVKPPGTEGVGALGKRGNPGATADRATELRAEGSPSWPSALLQTPNRSWLLPRSW